MSTHHRNATATLSAESLLALNLGVTGILDSIQNLRDVDKALIRRIPKMGAKTKTFTEQVLHLALANGDLLPRGLDLQVVKQQMELRDELNGALARLNTLTKRMKDNVVLLGSDSFSAALAAYRAMKSSRSSQIQGELQLLAEYFKQAQQEQEEETPENPGSGTV